MMNKLIFSIALVALTALGQNSVNVTITIPNLGIANVPATINGLGTKVSQYPNITTMQTNYLLLVADSANHTNYNINYQSFAAGIPALGSNFTVLNATTVSVDNITVTNGVTNSALSANQFVVTDANKRLVSTLNGNSLTNLSYVYDTNAVSSSAVLGFSHSYKTNLQANITLPAFGAINNAGYETLVLWCTNSTASDHSVTMPAGVVGPPGSGTPSVIWCTNKAMTRILVEHYALENTNASKTDFAP